MPTEGTVCFYLAMDCNVDFLPIRSVVTWFFPRPDLISLKHNTPNTYFIYTLPHPANTPQHTHT